MGKGIDPIAYGEGGGEGFLARTIRLSATTLSPRAPKICEFLFMIFGHIVAKFSEELICRREGSCSHEKLRK